MNAIQIRVGADVSDITEARARVRALLADACGADEITVTVPRGVYRPQDFVFDEADCSETCRVIWRAEEGAVIHGGITVAREAW